MMNKTITKQDLFELIDKKLKSESRFIIAIDGNACSGKTTLSEELKLKYDATVIHIDDFYKPRNKEVQFDISIMNEGNINYSRFKEQIIDHLQDEYLDYIRFNCSLQKEEEPEKIKLNNLIIVEGTYSLNPRLSRYFDISIFMKVDLNTQENRVRKRNPDTFKTFMNVRVKLEKNYFLNFDTEKRSDYILITND